MLGLVDVSKSSDFCRIRIFNLTEKVVGYGTRLNQLYYVGYPRLAEAFLYTSVIKRFIDLLFTIVLPIFVIAAFGPDQ